ncbi:hypothetical protein QBC35DRAFT_483622 [Podospora australis]|uniref:NAD(P)-binding domain-containing protein n=1 Tax=Podospora australis TaxID=1536484 RepID=A0AAN7APG4_9PEZI|nr:hypothetical protein QBC35DRAFT_483622 [Podospora australis]
MKVIITGATGLVGSALVRECLNNNAISHAFILTRNALPKDISANAKATVILHDDFSVYPKELLDQLAGAQGCLWSIGGRAGQFPDLETHKKVQVDYPVAAARAFQQSLVPEGQDFKFVFCSGKYAEWDQQKPLYFMSDTRRVKGQVEKALSALADAAKNFKVFIARPSGILGPSTPGLMSTVAGKLYDAIEVDKLAKAFVRIALEGHETRIVESAELIKLGNKL